MSQRPRTILVTGSGGPLGVNVTRSLRAANRGWTLVGTDCNHYHIPLSLTDHTELIAPARKRAEYYADIHRLVALYDIDMILATHPVEVRAISEHRDELPAGVTVFLPKHDTIHRAQNKWLTYQTMRDGGVPVPETRLIETRDDLQRCFDDIERRPVWVRGAGVPGIGVGVASLPCRDVATAAAWIDHYRGWGGFIASEFLPGRNLTWCGVYSDGALLVCQGRERLEYVIPHVSPSGITGAPAVSKTITEQRLLDIGDAAVRSIDAQPNGVFFVDLKEAPDGSARVTEINGGRFGTTIHFYTEAGFNFPELLVDAAFGRLPEARPVVDPIAPSTYWIRTLDCGPVLVRDLDK